MWSGLPALARWSGASANVRGSISPLLGGVSMSSLMGWLPDWLTVFFVALAFLFAFTVVEKFVKKIRERKRQPTIETKEESQQKKSNSEKPGEMFGSAVVQVRSANDERDQYRTEADEKAKELTKLRSDFKAFKQEHGL